MGGRGAGCLAHSSLKELPVKNLKFRFRVCDSDVGRCRIHLLPQAYWIFSDIGGNSLWGKETKLEGATQTHWANQRGKPAAASKRDWDTTWLQFPPLLCQPTVKSAPKTSASPWGAKELSPNGHLKFQGCTWDQTPKHLLLTGKGSLTGHDWKR